MRRHSQNISFVALIGILLSFTFFISQQINTESLEDGTVDTSLPAVESLEDLPDCSANLTGITKAECYADAAALSTQLVETKVDSILALEEDTGKRMAFIETQSSWEESRNADCTLIGELVEDADRQEIARNACLYEHNLERISLLEALICDYYDPSGCESPDLP